ncbi:MULTISPECIES: DUF4350 domain-containing protein [unclassified Brevundimonas]|uniref:DUF4350 domain-containing protein n=1 Tax=unclassified Brevundimonas TaxID=2622653 RepID=UPI002002F82D|nr:MULTISPECIES: DUF4350 domain-containing protein [unclassified Brevundimonas]MCK6104001.1 DUF4350 domain-containing protein [Brevundimonas sp. EYE_349]
MQRRSLLVGFAALAAWPRNVAAQEQAPDLDWRPELSSPGYAPASGPVILIDEAHDTLQTVAGRYAGFATLARADGYRVEALRQGFDAPGALHGADILVISNPRLSSSQRMGSAFSEEEIQAVAAWVEQGGALLLAVDHAPYGAAAEALGRRFGVSMGKGYAFQLAGADLTTNLVFPSPALGDHPIMRGRTPSEAIGLVRTFTGQSISGPRSATVLLAMSDDALEAPDLTTLQAIRDRLRAGENAGLVTMEMARPALSAQGLAFAFGAGRVVVLGEAGMLTAQMLRFSDGRAPRLMGLNTSGHDDQQFALNLLHWLSRLLP